MAKDNSPYALMRAVRAEGHRLRCTAALVAQGWRPPPRVIRTPPELDSLGFHCGIREVPADPMEFYPQVWEMGYQSGWCRSGRMFDPDDCSPNLPVVVLWDTDINQSDIAKEDVQVKFRMDEIRAACEAEAARQGALTPEQRATEDEEFHWEKASMLAALATFGPERPMPGITEEPTE